MIVLAGIEPKAEIVHWWFGVGFLMLGMFLLAEVIVGREVWGRRRWRLYLWPGTVFLMGVLMWPVMAFYTNSMIHMVAHGSWAQVLMLVRRGRARARPREAALAVLEALLRARVPRLRDGVPRARAEHVVLRARRVPPPRARLGR